MEYWCPEDVVVLFDDDRTKPFGRARAIAWIDSLNLEVGDIVHLPEVGRVIKTAGRIQ